MDGNPQPPLPVEIPSAEPAQPEHTSTQREAAIMAEPPRDILADASALTDAGGGRYITPAQQAQLATPPTGASASPQVNSRQFGAKSVAPNEFKITHKGLDLQGKVLTPTEVPVVLGWLNSLPPDEP